MSQNTPCHFLEESPLDREKSALLPLSECMQMLNGEETRSFLDNASPPQEDKVPSKLLHHVRESLHASLDRYAQQDWVSALWAGSIVVGAFSFIMLGMHTGSVGAAFAAGSLVIGSGVTCAIRGSHYAPVSKKEVMEAFHKALPCEREVLLEATAVLPVRVKAWKKLLVGLEHQERQKEDDTQDIRILRTAMMEEELRRAEVTWKRVSAMLQQQTSSAPPRKNVALSERDSD